MAFLAGNDVKLLDPLKAPLSGINKKAQGSLQEALGKIGERQTESARASGRIRGEYAPAELGRAGTMASSSIEDALAGALGNASYDEIRKQKEHEQNLALAREIGDLTAPSVLQQVLSGLGGAASAAGAGKALYDSLGRQSYNASTPVDFGISSPSYYGLDYPSMDRIRGYRQYPNELRGGY